MARAQFNLLPDVKLRYIKAERARNLVLSIASLVSLAALAIFLLAFLSVSVVQKTQLSNVDKDIVKANTQINNLKGLDQVLTVQNQLQTLVGLHHSKHISSRIFTYLPEVTPTNVSVGRLNLDFNVNTMQIDGTADSQQTVNVFIDTLKFTTFTIDAKSTAKSAFPSVVESSFSIDVKNVSYSLNVSFDPILFSNDILDNTGKAIAPSLKVPKLTTTRSVVDDPGNVLFNGQFNPPGTGSGGQ